MTRQLVWRLLAVLVVLGGAISLVVTREVRLGLDLEGGTQIVLQAQPTEAQEIDDDTLVRTLEVMRRRVDELGVAEPSLQRSGGDRIIIELPGVTDPEEALEVIGRTAQMTFHRVEGIAGGGNQDDEGGENEENQQGGDQQGDDLILPDEDGNRLRLSPADLTGDAVGNARADPDAQFGLAWQVTISWRGDGTDTWAGITGEAACAPLGEPQRRVAIVLDEEIISSPEVGTEVECDVGITGGDTVITGDFSEAEAKDLALLIRAGALPVPVEVIEQRTVGPTLGDAAVRASVQAAIIGGALTILYVIAYYRLLGVLAAFALLAYGVMSYAVLLAIGATLTLPGIAGFVLAIGMAVDANVLVFERSKEEFSAGKSLRAAALDGFKKAWSAIADSNATTLLAALILFFFAAGAVRGFGITLTIGVIVSMFTALVLTRVLVDLSMRTRFMSTRPAAMGMNVGGRLRKRLEERPIDIMSRAKWWFALSSLVLVISGVGLFVRGLNFGLDFTGGRLIEFSTSSPVDLDEVRAELASAGFARAVVQESEGGNVSVRVGELSADQEGDITAAVESVGGETEEVRDEFVGPTIGDELRRRAFIALGLGLGIQLLYLAVRFRWTFGASAVVALFHDVGILLGLFAWLQKDIDGVFVAALLTVIGYSINDSVVVFDRIRERRRLRVQERLSVVANEACLSTIPRTINTGLGALFILIALYFLGGETLTDFAFALIVGILVGTYSSVFTAAPVAVAFDRLSPAPEAAVSGPAAARATSQRRQREKPAAASAASAKAAPEGSPRTTTQKRPARTRAGAAKRKRRRRR